MNSLARPSLLILSYKCDQEDEFTPFSKMELRDDEPNSVFTKDNELVNKKGATTCPKGAVKDDSQPYETICWGCGQHLYLASIAPLFKCAWCGAITSHKEKAKKQSVWSTWNKVRDCLFITIVLVFVASIVYGGVWAIFPSIFKNSSLSLYVHSIITIILASNVLLNYVLAIWVSPGPPRPVAWGSTDVVSKGMLEGHRFCNLCKVPKAPRVHHCTTCKQCVLDLDHHCPFIGNCVGANTIRHFLSFLISALVGSLYAFCLSLYAGVYVWPTVIGLKKGVSIKPIGSSTSMEGILAINALSALLSANLELSIQALVLLYVAVSTLSTLVGLSILLYHQLYYLYNGHTFLESIQSGASATIKIVSTKSGWSNIANIFEGQPPLFWILPTFFLPCAAGSHKKKICKTT